MSVVRRWQITSVVLAVLVLLMPLQVGTAPFYGSLSVPQVTLATFVGVSTGWFILDRAAAHREESARIALIALCVAAALSYVVLVTESRHPGPRALVLSTIGVSIAIGGLLRGTTDGRRSMASLVAISTATTWVAYDLVRLPMHPLRDLDLYLGAGSAALGGASPYISAPVTSTADPANLPFVYPPFTIPAFELLATIPRPVAIALWEGGSIAAVVTALWILGVRGRWLLVLLAWPALSVGIAVGNVASFTFLLYTIGFRLGAALVLSGVFKIQSTIPSLWLVRERRWRELTTGAAIVIVLALISLPIVGVPLWLQWPSGLRAFQNSFITFPALQGESLVRFVGPTIAFVLTVLAIGCSFLRRGRNSLARFGLASIVGSPTLSLHGLSPLLAGASCLGPELLWFFLAFGPWPFPFAVRSSWVAMAIAGVALQMSRGNDLDLPTDLNPSRADVHPVAASGRVWPDRRADG